MMEIKIRLLVLTMFTYNLHVNKGVSHASFQAQILKLGTPHVP